MNVVRSDDILRRHIHIIVLADLGPGNSSLVDLLVLFSGHSHENAHVRISNLGEVVAHGKIEAFVPGLLVDVFGMVNDNFRAILDPINFIHDFNLFVLQGLALFSGLAVRLLGAKALLHELIFLLSSL